MGSLSRGGRRCVAMLADGTRCTKRAVNGSEAQLCRSHSGGKREGRKGAPRHGFYAGEGNEGFEYLMRVSPEEYVRQGGVGVGAGNSLGIRERAVDLHPLDPGDAAMDVAIAGLTHKMEILDALIFRAKEQELDVVQLLSLYVGASTRLGRLVRDREELAKEGEGVCWGCWRGRRRR